MSLQENQSDDLITEMDAALLYGISPERWAAIRRSGYGPEPFGGKDGEKSAQIFGFAIYERSVLIIWAKKILPQLSA